MARPAVTRAAVLVFYQGRTLQAAEELSSLKGTGFSSYVSGYKQVRLLAAEGHISIPKPDDFP